MRTPEQEAAYDYGKEMICALHGVDTSVIVKQAAAEKVYDSPAGVVYKKSLCKIASTIFDSTGNSGAPAAIMFNKLAATKDWYTAFDRYTDAVRSALAKEASTGMTKEAIGPLALLGGASQVAPEILKIMAGTGIGIGVLGGAAAHLVNGKVAREAVANESMVAKIKAYNRVRRDIEEDLLLSGALDRSTAKEDSTPSQQTTYAI